MPRSENEAGTAMPGIMGFPQIKPRPMRWRVVPTSAFAKVDTAFQITEYTGWAKGH